MAYISPWQRLAEVASRVGESTSRSQAEVQADICRAIANRAIAVRGKLGPPVSAPMRYPDTVLEGVAFRIPTDLKPTDLDWVKSRPTEPWLVLRDVSRRPGYFELEWIELLQADVTTVFCSADAGSSRVPRPVQQDGVKARRRPARERVERSLRELYPDGVPEQADEPNKTLCRRVGEWLKEKSLPEAKDDTILRAAKRRM